MMRAPSPHPRLATESTESTEDPTHSPYSCCFPSPHRLPVFIRNQTPLGGAKQKKAVRGSVDSVAIQSSIGAAREDRQRDQGHH